MSQAKPQKVKWVKPPKLGLLEQMYFPTVISGMATTLKHMDW